LNESFEYLIARPEGHIYVGISVKKVRQFFSLSLNTSQNALKMSMWNQGDFVSMECVSKMPTLYKTYFYIRIDGKLI